VSPDIDNLKDLKRSYVNDLWSSGKLDCETYAFSLEYYPAFAFSDSAFQSPNLGSSLESPFNLAATFSKVWTRRVFLGVGAGISSDNQIDGFLDFKYAPSLGSVSPLFSLRAGTYLGINNEDFIPYLNEGIGIRLEVFNGNYMDYHIQFQQRFNTINAEGEDGSGVTYMLMSFRYIWIIVDD